MIGITENDLVQAILFNGPLLTRGCFTVKEAREHARIMLAGPRMLELLTRLLEDGSGPIVDEGWDNPTTVEAQYLLNELRGEQAVENEPLSALVASAGMVVNLWSDQYSQTADDEEKQVWMNFVKELNKVRGE